MNTASRARRQATPAPSWLVESVAELDGQGRPRLVRASELPPLVIEGHLLDSREVGAVMAALRQARGEITDLLVAPGGLPASSSLPAVPRLLCELRQWADPDQLDAFAWALADTFFKTQPHWRHDWAVFATRLLGGTLCARGLGRLARRLSPSSDKPSMGQVLLCLRDIGTEAAFEELAAIAHLPAHRVWRADACLAMEQVAELGGFAADEVEHRAVPTCGLDAGGRRLFDFGPRQFEGSIGPRLKPVSRDSTGRTRSTLPRAGADDNPECVARACAEWKQFREDVAETLRYQSDRLEYAMVVQQTWSASLFETYVAGHPVVGCLARRLVWATLDENGLPARTFRVVENGTLADVEDREFALQPQDRVTIVHPSLLSDEQLQQWSEHLADDELMQPFLQLARGRHRVPPQQREAAEWRLAEEETRRPEEYRKHFKQHGWMRFVSPDTSTLEYYHWFELSQQAVLAVIECTTMLTNAWTTDVTPAGLRGCRFFAGDDESEDRPLPLGQVAPIAFSETLTLVEALGISTAFSG